jgi:hypothetical protein
MGSTAQDFLQVSFSVACTLGGLIFSVGKKHNDDAPNAWNIQQLHRFYP